MKANELLFWLSARREGSWRQFRQAVEELHSSEGETSCEANDEFPLHQQLRLDFERLAHVEFFAAECENGWRVAPPTLATHSVSGGVRGVLCGARSPALRERVARGAEKFKGQVLDALDVPDVIRIVGEDVAGLEELAARVGILFQADAPFAILTHLPPCDPPSRMRSASEFPHGSDWTMHEFDAQKLAWCKIERREAQKVRFGVLRFLIHFQRPRYFLRWKDSTFEMPRAVALYALLHRYRRDVLRYNRDAAALSIPAICRPPRLLERALVLCSGLPPVYADGQLTYLELPPEVVRLAAELLRQPLASPPYVVMPPRVNPPPAPDYSDPFDSSAGETGTDEDKGSISGFKRRGPLHGKGQLQTKCPFCDDYFYEEARDAHMRSCPRHFTPPKFHQTDGFHLVLRSTSAWARCPLCNASVAEDQLAAHIASCRHSYSK